LDSVSSVASSVSLVWYWTCMSGGTHISLNQV
jgi:hypothetical protein